MLRFESPKRVAGKKPPFVEAPKSQWLASAAGRVRKRRSFRQGNDLNGTHVGVVSNKAANAAGKIFEAFFAEK